MCTVVFYPGSDGIKLASLRDESPIRPVALKPRIYTYDSYSYLSPIDPLGGGSWIGVNDSGVVIILLNGGYQIHERKDYYSKSRGLVVKELLSSSMPVIDWGKLSLDGVEPFTLVLYDGQHLFQLVWDGNEKHRNLMDKSIPYLWSSSTLYDDKIRQVRFQLFQKWIKTQTTISSDTLKGFFSSYPDEINGFIMNRNDKIKTVNYSFITVLESKAQYEYHDFQHGEKSFSEIQFDEKFEVCLLSSDKENL
jgi:uncharacterized protein with NRDE domain